MILQIAGFFASFCIMLVIWFIAGSVRPEQAGYAAWILWAYPLLYDTLSKHSRTEETDEFAGIFGLIVVVFMVFAMGTCIYFSKEAWWLWGLLPVAVFTSTFNWGDGGFVNDIIGFLCIVAVVVSIGFASAIDPTIKVLWALVFVAIMGSELPWSLDNTPLRHAMGATGIVVIAGLTAFMVITTKNIYAAWGIAGALLFASTFPWSGKGPKLRPHVVRRRSTVV